MALAARFFPRWIPFAMSISLGASEIWAIVAFLVMPTAKDPKGQTTDGVDTTPTSSWS
jgi:hypothetical protein